MNLLLACIASIVYQQTTGASLPGQIGLVNIASKLGPITGVKVDLDTLHHTIYKGQADVFLGIPYAQAPNGNLRFQLPQPKSAWTQPLNATTYSTNCPQGQQDLASGPNLIEDEDCLYMNIYRPMGLQANAKLPVMIWLYGGGFTGGSLTEFSPTEGIITNLVSKGVIVVTMNYRLGIFAIVHTEELSYVFIWDGYGFFNLSVLSTADRGMIDYMGTMWTNFAKYGDPTPANVRSPLPFKWQPFDATNNYLYINSGSTGMKANYYPKSDQIFNQIIPNIVRKVQQSGPTPTLTPTTGLTRAATASSFVNVSSCLSLIFDVARGFNRP